MLWFARVIRLLGRNIMSNDTLGAVFDARNNSMNIMRLLAALAVIYGHASAVTGRGPGDLFLQFVGYKFIGGVAVDVFFVLSGFLITASAMSGKGIRYFVVSRCRIPDDCIDKNRYPLFMARSVLRELIESLPSTRSL